MKGNSMKKVFGTLIAVLLLGLLLFAAWTQRVLLADAFQQVSLGQLLLLIVVMLPLYPLSVLAWHQLLLGLGGQLTYREALAVWMMSNIARLLPGTVWQWVGRVYLAGGHGIGRLEASLSVGYEIATLVVTALLVGFGTLPLWPISIELPWWLGLLGLGPLALLWPTTLPWVVARYAAMKGESLGAIPPLPVRRLLAAIGATVLHFGLNGVAIWFLVGLFAPQPIVHSIAYAGMYALAWLLGYATIIAPGGVGVADASLAGLLGAQVGVAVGSAVAILYRGLLFVSELLVTGIAIALHPNILKTIDQSTKKQTPSTK